MANTSANYRIKLAAVLDTKTINQQINQLNKNNTLKELKIKVTISDASLRKIKELNDLLNKTEALNKYTSGLKNIQDTMKSYEKIASKVVTATNNMAIATGGMVKAVKSAEPQVKSFGDKAKDAFQKFALWSGISNIYYKVIETMKQLVDVAIELDTAFVELQKVTDLTMDDFDDITEKAYGLGSEVAKTTTEVVKAMTEFAKAGYSVEESTDILAKNALMWTNIADGTVDVSESANMIISIMKAFNVEAENTTHIIDALNEVSNNFAVSSGDLSSSLTKSSAVLANAGATYEEQLGLITAGTEILRNANIVSNGLKTISLRLQGMTEDGEAVDGLSAKLEKDFNKLGLTLYDLSGALKSPYEILKDLSEVYPTLTEAEKAYYTELIAGKNRAQVAAAILNNFSTAIQATETAYNSAGSAAIENAKVLDSIQGKLQDVKAEFEALASDGGLNDVIKGTLSLTAGLLKLINTLGGLKGILVGFLAYLILFKKTAIISMVTTITASLIPAIKMLAFKAIMWVILAFGNLKLSISTANIALQTHTATLATFGAVAKAALPILSLIAMAIAAVIGVVNSADNAAREAMTTAKESAKTLKTFNDEVDASIDRIREYKGTLDSATASEEAATTAKEGLIAIQDSLVEKYGDEAKGIDLVNGSIDEQIKKIRQLQQEKSSQWLRENQKGIEAAHKTKEDQGMESIFFWGSDSWDGSHLLRDIANMYGYSNTTGGTFGVGEFDIYGSDVEILSYLKKASDYILQNKDYLMKAYGMSEDGIQDVLNDLGTHITTYAEKVGDAEEVLKQEALNNMIKSGEYWEYIDQLSAEGEQGTLNMTRAAQILGTEGVQNFETAGYSLQELVDTYNDSSKVFDNLFSGNIDTDSFVEGAKNLIYTNNLTKESVQNLLDTNPEVKAYFSDYGYSVEEVIKLLRSYRVEANDVLNITDKFANKAKTVGDSYSILDDAISEFNDNGGISADTLSKLATTMITLSDGTETALINLISFTNNGVEVNRKALEDSIKTLKEKAVADIQESTAQKILQLTYENVAKAADETETKVDENKETLEGSIEADAKKIASNIGLATSYDTLKEAAEGEGIDTSNWDSMSTEIQNILTEGQNAISAIMNFTYTQNDDNKTFKTADAWKDAFLAAYNDLKNRRDRDLIDTKTYQKELDKLNNKYFKDRVKYEEDFYKYKLELYKLDQEIFDEEIDKFDHQIAMMEYNEVDTETLIAKHREAQARIHEEAERYRKLAKEEGLEGVEDIIDKYEELWWKYETSIDKYRQKDEEEIQERFEAIQRVAIEAIDAEIEALENDLEKQNDLLDEAIARYEEENDALEDQEEIQEKLLAIEEARKKLAEAKNNKVRVYREGKGFVYETDFDAVAEAQSELDSLLEEWDLFQEKSKIADIIAQLEAEKEANEKRVEEEIKDLNRLKDEWDKSLDISEDVEEYKAYLEELGESEQSNFNKRLKAVKDFTEAYKAEMATLSPTPTTEDSSVTSSPLGYASGQRGSGKNSYNVFVDYQAEIDKAIASGAPADHLAYLEQKRNNKIDGEGLDYEKTYNYQYVPGKSDSSSSGSSGSSKSSSSKNSSGKSSSSSKSLLSKVTSAISSIGKAIKSATGLATGTDNADGLMHFVGENGPELYIPPKGSGIIPNPNTTNLMAWGTINPMDLVRKFGDTGGTNIDIDNITLPNVKDAESFVEELKNFKSFAIQKQSVRR